MPAIETNTRKVIGRLRREGWIGHHGGSHDLFKHPKRPGVRITVPRHTTLSPGVARTIAKAAGWIE